jgi:hypothetical protein
MEVSRSPGVARRCRNHNVVDTSRVGAGGR